MMMENAHTERCFSAKFQRNKLDQFSLQVIHTHCHQSERISTLYLYHLLLLPIIDTYYQNTLLCFNICRHFGGDGDRRREYVFILFFSLSHFVVISLSLLAKRTHKYGQSACIVGNVLKYISCHMRHISLSVTDTVRTRHSESIAIQCVVFVWRRSNESLIFRTSQPRYHLAGCKILLI